MVRAGCVALICPAVGPPMEAFGLEKFARLNELNISQRNVNLAFSVMLKARWIPRSALKYPGPSRMPTPALPKVYCFGMAKALTSNQRLIVRWSLGRSPVPTRLARSAPDPFEAVFDTAVARPGETCVPVIKLQSPEAFQFPTTW